MIPFLLGQGDASQRNGRKKCLVKVEIIGPNPREMELPLTLRSSRKGILPLVVVALVFVALGFLVLRWEPTVGWLAIGFFGLCAVAKSMSWYVSTLPDTYGLSAEDLAELLNRLRDEHAT